jgi:hypothetical protein
MRKLRVVFLGYGGIVEAHAPAFEAARDVCEVVAVADPVPGNIARARFGAQLRGYDDYAALLAQEKLDGVDITLPHHLHTPATEAAADPGAFRFPGSPPNLTGSPRISPNLPNAPQCSPMLPGSRSILPNSPQFSPILPD